MFRRTSRPFTAVALALLVTASVVCPPVRVAAAADQPTSAQRNNAAAAAPLERLLASFVTRLNLTSEQRAEVTRLIAAERPVVEPLVRRLLALPTNFFTLARASSFDENAARTLAAAEITTITDLIVARERIGARIYRLLTPEQRALLGEAGDAATSRDITLSQADIRRIAEELGLTGVQQFSLALILPGEFQTAQPLVNSITDLQRQLRLATRDGEFVESVVRPNATQQAAVAAELIVIGSRTLARVYATLTPAQRAIIEAAYARLSTVVDVALVFSIDDTRFFVQQQYIDFLNRFPEPTGFQAWVRATEACAPGDAACLQNKRVETSSGFFRSQEFFDTGYFVFRLYATTLARRPRFAEFTPDARQLDFGAGGDRVAASKLAFATAWLQRPEFAALGLSNDPATFARQVAERAGVQLSAAEQAQLSALSRAEILVRIVDNQTVLTREYNSAFVTMQYFGYLRRDPEQSGYEAWMRVLNEKPGDYPHMIWGFIYSPEYRNRFGSSN